MIKKLLNFLLNRIKSEQGSHVYITGDVRFSKIKLKGKGHKLEIIGGSCRNLDVDISGSNNSVKIILPRDVRNLRIIVKDDNNLVEIGEHSGVVNSRIVCCGSGKNIHISAGAMIADGCEIWNCDTHSILSSITGERVNPAGNIKIGSRVWLGRGVSINKGVTIGDDCVIGACSMVFKGEHASNTVYAGSPARPVRENITWCIDRV